MTLSDYVRQVGPDEFARKFGVSVRAAISYMYGDRCPKPQLANRIVKKTPVSWEGVYAGAIKKRPN
jgi:hypothetical protein